MKRKMLKRMLMNHFIMTYIALAEPAHVKLLKKTYNQ